MTRREIIVASIVGLVFAIAATALYRLAISGAAASLVVAALCLLAAGVAGRVVLGTRRLHRYVKLAVVVLAAISGFAFESAVSNWLISRQVSFGPVPTALVPSVVAALVIGAIAYLLAAVAYGFAGRRQGVGVGSRVGLLLLLLLAVLPGLNVLGSIGLVIIAFTRRPASTTQAPPAAST